MDSLVIPGKFAHSYLSGGLTISGLPPGRTIPLSTCTVAEPLTDNFWPSQLATPPFYDCSSLADDQADPPVFH